VSPPERKGRRPSAVWQLALPGILVFALGSAAVLLLAYRSTDRAVHEQFDALLAGEAADLASEAAGQPPEGLADWVEQERQDLLRFLDLRHDAAGAAAAGAAPRQVVLVILDAGEPVAWSGTAQPRALLAAALRADGRAPVTLRPGAAAPPLRVAHWQSPGGRGALVALTPPGREPLLRRIALTLALLWAVVLAISSVLSWWSVRRVLGRVDRLTRAAVEIADPESGRRLPEAARDDEIGELAQSLNGMLERIAAASREVRQLSQAVAHDLRSPVTVIRGRLEMALVSGDPARVKEAAGDTLEGLDRLAAMLEATLDVAEAEGGALRLRRRPVDLGTLCREMAELYELAAAEAGARLTVETTEDLVVDADPHLLRRALANLLDNVLTHAPQARRIGVRAWRQADGDVCVAVEDDGPGMPAELRQRAFEGEARRPGSPGLGLGLQLVRAAARAHGGAATLDAGRLGGTAVTLRLPADRG